MSITIELEKKDLQLIHTFIRRSIFEDYIRPMREAGDSPEDTENRVYQTIEAMGKIRRAIEQGD